jgi:hypothetical protein
MHAGSLMVPTLAEAKLAQKHNNGMHAAVAQGFQNDYHHHPTAVR